MRKLQITISLFALTMLTAPASNAQRAGFSASAEEIMIEASSTFEEPSTQKIMGATLLTTSFKSHGRTTFYKIDLAAACLIKRFTLGTGVDTKNNSELGATVEVWAEIDGQVVSIADNEPAQKAGKVTLCGQLEWDEASRGNRDDLTTASAFSWVATNLQKGTHQLEIKSTLTAFANSGIQAGNAIKAIIGKRLVTVNQFK